MEEFKVLFRPKEEELVKQEKIKQIEEIKKEVSKEQQEKLNKLDLEDYKEEEKLTQTIDITKEEQLLSIYYYCYSIL